MDNLVERVVITDVQFSGKMTAVNLDSESPDKSPLEENEREKRAFEVSANILGVPSDWYQKSFYYKMKHFTITGLNPSRPKNSVVLRDEAGNVYKGGVGQIRAML